MNANTSTNAFDSATSECPSSDSTIRSIRETPNTHQNMITSTKPTSGRRTDQPENGETGGNNTDRAIHGIRWFLVCVAIYSANFLYGLDTTIVADLQGAIAETYSNVAQLGWLGAGFSLGSTVAILPLGKAYGMFDNKWLFTICLANFAAASALCGGAPSMNAMIVGRVWAGAGGAGMYLGTLNIVSRLCSPKERPVYLSLVAVVYGGGCILGPIVGGAFADSSASWRWAFYLNLLIFGVASPIYLFLLPLLPRREDDPFWEKVKTLDWVGMILTAGLYVSFTMAFIFGGATWEYSDPRVIALIVVFGVCTVAFCLSQHLSLMTTKLDRLFPCDLLRDRQLVLLYICMASGGASLFVAIYYIPVYYLFVNGDSGIQAAVRLLPFICFYVTGILACGALMGHTGYHKLWYLASGVLIIVGSALMYTVRRSTSSAHIVGYTILLGLGMTTTQAGYAVGSLLVTPERVPDLIQFLNISQGQSQLLGLAIASAIFQSETFRGLKRVLDGRGFSDAEIRFALAGARSRVLESVSEEVRNACVDVIVSSISKIWVMVIAAGCLWTVCSLLLTQSRFVGSAVKVEGEKEVESSSSLMV